MDLGWKADACKLQKHHPKYDHAHCSSQILAQTNSKLNEPEFGSEKNFKEALDDAQKFRNKYQDAKSIPDSELPANFDLRNIKGVDFTNPHKT